MNVSRRPGPWARFVDAPEVDHVLKAFPTLTSFGDRDQIRIAVAAFLCAFGYYLGNLVGFALTPLEAPISTFWPPNAILLAILLLVPRKYWWILLLAVLPAHLLAQLPTGVPITTCLGWYISNVAEAVLGAFLISQFQDNQKLFSHVRGLTIFLVFGVFGAPLLTSFLDAAVVTGTGMGKDYWLLWTTRFLSNMIATFTLVPVIVLTFSTPSWFRRTSWRADVEACAVILLVALVITYGFKYGASERGHVRFVYMLFPLLLWISLRFGVFLLSFSLLAISLCAAWGATHSRWPFLSDTLIGNVLSMQLFLCMVALPFMYLGAVLAELRETTRFLVESKSRLIDTQEQERRRIARELHDGVGQELALLETELSQLQQTADPNLTSRLSAAIQQLSEISTLTREISHGLHPSHLEYLGLDGAMRKLCRDFSKEGSLEIRYYNTNVPERLDFGISLSLFRVAQEALSNVTKYSRASHVQIRLQRKQSCVWMDIIDDGIGFETDRQAFNGIGLANMRDRMELVGGKITIKSAPMQGTRIRALVPTNSRAA